MKFSVIIMAGGSGKRFWPLSRESRAKQSIPLLSDKTLLAETIKRIRPVCEDILVVSSFKQKESIETDIENSGVSVIYEPSGRNTAPCIMLALHFLKKKFAENRAVLVLPADHHVANAENFRKTISNGLDYLEKNSGSIGTLGITPNRPETGFGYIKKEKKLEDTVFSVASFEEKPPVEKAEKFVKSGNYLWNAGIFLFSLNSMIGEFKKIAYDIYTEIKKIDFFDKVDDKIYSSIRSISFDYAIMEHTSCPIFTVPGDFGWSDVGNWLAYYELLPKDENANASKGRVHFINSENSLAVNLTDKTLVLFRKTGELTVATEDTVFSASLEDHQKLREVTDYLKKSGNISLL